MPIVVFSAAFDDWKNNPPDGADGRRSRSVGSGAEENDHARGGDVVALPVDNLIATARKVDADTMTIRQSKHSRRSEPGGSPATISAAESIRSSRRRRVAAGKDDK
jgi:hypothetical protein